MAKLTIGVDFRPALSHATGVGRYFEGLVGGLGRVDSENNYVLFSSSWKERPELRPRPDNFRLIDRRVPVRVLNALWHRFETPSLDWLAGERLDVAHSPTPLILPTRRGRTIITICDLFFLERPEATSREIRRDYVNLVRSHARKADAVIAISETTARDVQEKLDVPPERITVIHAGLDSRFSGPTEKVTPAVHEDYILTVASLEPRKNLTRLLEALALLRERGFEGRLRIAGGDGLDAPRVDDTIHRLMLEDSVDKLGYVDAAALVSLYRSARIVVMPSLWEGFGLPLLEAMASETPLVASDIPVHREVAGDAALFAPPGNVRALADTIDRTWCDQELRAQLVARGLERKELFSWDASANKARSLYERVAGKV